MKAATPVGLLALVVLLAGCGNTTATTEVRPDGSFKRTVKLVVPESTLGTPIPLEKVYALPMGAPWTATRTRDKDRNIVFTSFRDVPAGSGLAGDVTILKAGKPFVATQTKVVKNADGTIEYRERITYLGSDKPDLAKAMQDLGAGIQSALPPGKATTAEAERMGRGIIREMWRAFFGPGDPLLGHLFSHPGLLEKRFRRDLGASADRLAREVLGQRLTNAERREFVRKLVLSGDFDDRGLFDPQKEADKPNPGSQGAPEFVSMLFVAKMPGRVVSTNGEYDPIADEVVWALYPIAAQLDPVDLVAVCKP